MSRVMTGSKGSLKLNGVKIAYVGGLNVNEENALTDIDVLDQLEVAEHAETGHKVSFTCNVFRIDGNASTQLGIRAVNIRDILSQPELTMEIYNSVDDRVELTISGVKYEGGSYAVEARGVASGTFNFKGRISSGI